MERITAICAIARVFGYRIRGMVELLEGHVSPEELVKMGCNDMRPFIGERAVDLSREVSDGILKWAENEINETRRRGIGLATYESDEYPQLLRECCDAPLLIYYRGDLPGLTEREWWSVVGTRKPTAYGISVCRTVTERICGQEDTVIVSGLAYGIDKIAHETALKEGCPTVGVMATGADRMYPASHISLARRILKEGGALISDFPLGTRPVAVNFLRRNRIIAGASMNTVVIESPMKGGSMVTATEAYSYNRNLYAVPGNITSPYSQGCNYLISSGMAECVSSPDIFGFLHNPPHKLAPEEQMILKILSANNGRSDTESIASVCNLSIPQCSAILTELELKQEICNEDGINWSIIAKK